MQADEAAVEAAAHATASAHAVFFSLYHWLELWPWLDRDSKAALRGVSISMRRQVDGSIQVVASPASDFSPDALTSVLLRWPRTTYLTLLNMRGADDLAPLATTTALARFTSLTVRQAPRASVGVARHWDMLATTLGSSVAATLRVIDLSGCINLGSIDVVRSCAQLRCLWMPGCVCVSDLSPLGACSETLEELWMSRNLALRSLAPLQACLPALNAQVPDLQLSCTQLAAPSSVEVEGLVHDLQTSLLIGMQAYAAQVLAHMLFKEGRLEAHDAFVAAGGIPALVKLLAADVPARVQLEATFALRNLAANYAHNQAAISAAGAIPALVQLLGPSLSAGVQARAAGALGRLAANHAEDQGAAADAIPALVWLLGHGSAVITRMAAARALRSLAANHAQNYAAIDAAGAIKTLVQLLGPDMPPPVCM
ncbi:hypothetical protein FOA52_001512 [Chlamydomonas sp. UWO 241]|nr:hypothetical protein FOA52_001512 [Chlamydomonas sp. UWO 241]